MEALYPSSEYYLYPPAAGVFNLKEVPRGQLSKYLIGGGGLTVSILLVCWMLYVLLNKYNFSIVCKCTIANANANANPNANPNFQLRDIESQTNGI